MGSLRNLTFQTSKVKECLEVSGVKTLDELIDLLKEYKEIGTPSEINESYRVVRTLLDTWSS